MLGISRDSSGSSTSTFRPAITSFNPWPKLAVQMQALTIVSRIRIIVMTAKVVKDFRTGL